MSVARSVMIAGHSDAHEAVRHICTARPIRAGVLHPTKRSTKQLQKTSRLTSLLTKPQGVDPPGRCTTETGFTVLCPESARAGCSSPPRAGDRFVPCRDAALVPQSLCPPSRALRATRTILRSSRTPLADSACAPRLEPAQPAHALCRPAPCAGAPCERWEYRRMLCLYVVFPSSSRRP